MQRKTAPISALSLAFLVSSLVYAQDSQPGPSPLPPSQTVTVGAQLIVWSELQKPQPIQQHVTQPAAPQANQQPPSSAGQTSPAAAAAPTRTDSPQAESPKTDASSSNR